MTIDEPLVEQQSVFVPAQEQTAVVVMVQKKTQVIGLIVCYDVVQCFVRKQVPGQAGECPDSFA
jgi:hypothetical protein